MAAAFDTASLNNLGNLFKIKNNFNFDKRSDSVFMFLNSYALTEGQLSASDCTRNVWSFCRHVLFF
jgi:hypothetical protein